MPKKNYDYIEIYLSDEFIIDPTLMMMAWKKSHEYIRTLNWYADNFELDLSSLNISELILSWTKEIKSRMRFQDLELVPAPKQTTWSFLDKTDEESNLCLDWVPVEEKSSLRPLANISIRDQTYMSLIMMCLANQVETMQGDPETSYDEVHQDGVVSYGNRLYCKYFNKKAKFALGSSATYSKYFTDYRRFLQRPYYFAQKAMISKNKHEDVFIIEMDISKFYDCVDRIKLIEMIEEIKGLNLNSKGVKVSHLNKAFLNWNWTEDSLGNFIELDEAGLVENKTKGLPQGLVSAGFFSNIYMLEFDEEIKNILSSESESGFVDDIKLLDYCRYVDDIRLVVQTSLNKGSHSKTLIEIKDKVSYYIDDLLSDINLKSNHNKTKIEIFRGKTSGISNYLEQIQTRLSGPVSFDEAYEQLGKLESMLVLSPLEKNIQSGNGCRINRLALIEKDIYDVRDDTIKRFSANKISALLKEIRHFTSRDVDNHGDLIPGDWDFLQERIARRFIACWTRDPSLIHLLKKGLDLFPSKKIIEPIIEQLELIRDKNLYQKSVSDFCLSEIFRHSAIFIHSKNLQSIPAHADVDKYFEYIQSKASGLITARNSYPGFLKEQARFLLLVRMDTVLDKKSTKTNHDLIFKLSCGYRNINTKLNDSEVSACVIIANQLCVNNKPLLRATSSLIMKSTIPEEIIEKIACQDIEFLRDLVSHARLVKHQWVFSPKVKKIIDLVYLDSIPNMMVLSDITGARSLYELVTREDNPYRSEAMCLKLIKSLLSKANKINSLKNNEVIDIHQTKVTLDGAYTIPVSFEVFDSSIEIEINSHEYIGGVPPYFQELDEDDFVLHRIGLCMLTVMRGGFSTIHLFDEKNNISRYRGIRSGTYKQQFGMMLSPEMIQGKDAEVSYWLTTLISKFLKWPGVNMGGGDYKWPSRLSIENVVEMIDERLFEAKSMYCKQSHMPSIVEKVKLDWNDSKDSLSVVMVQSKIPSASNFKDYGFKLDDAKFRVKHRRHIAQVAQLAIKYIEAQKINSINDNRADNIDIIVWPEIAVHYDDIDILIKLSRKSHSVIYSGMTFYGEGKELRNCAIWIVPEKHNQNNHEIIRYQGKKNLTQDEIGRVSPWRPYQFFLELSHPKTPFDKGFLLTGSICYDATDIALSSDLRGKSNAYFISAANKDLNTFETIVESLHYSLYQHVVLVNSGEFGGSLAKAPYKLPHHRLLTRLHGNNQISINSFEMNMFDFRLDGVCANMKSGLDVKSAPAGISFHLTKKNGI